MAGASTESLQVTWQAASDFNISSYTLQMDNGANGAFSTVYTGPLSIVNITGLVPATSYRFQLASINHVGTGPYSSIVFLSTAATVNPGAVPTAPTNLVATILSMTSIAMQWTPPGVSGTIQPPTAYELELATPSTQFHRVYLGADTQFTVTGLQAASPYQFRVRGHNDAGPGAYSPLVSYNTTSTPGNETVPGAPDAPQLVTASYTELEVTWNPVVQAGFTVDTYSLEMSGTVDVEQWQVVCTVAVPGCNVTGLTAGTLYAFRVRGSSMGAFGPYSPIAQLSTLSQGSITVPPDAPYPLARNVASIILAWNAPNSQATSFVLEMAENVANFSTLFDGTVQQTEVDGLNLTTTYYFRVRARSALGLSEPSPVTAISTAGGAADAVLGAPTAPQMLTVDASSISVRWEAATAGTVLAYVLEMADQPNGIFTTKYSGLAQNATVSSLSANTAYYFRVRAYNNAGPGADSGITAIQTSGVPENYAPGVPGPALLISRTESSIAITWAPPTVTPIPISQYRVERSMAQAGPFSLVYVGLQRQFNSTGLSPATAYWFRIRAENAYGIGNYTDPVALETTGAIFQRTLNTSDYAAFYETPQGDFGMYWKVLADGTTLEVAMRARTLGWVAFGLASSADSVPNGDYIIGTVTNNVVTVYDYFGANHSVGCTNSAGICRDLLQGGRDDVLASTGSQTTTETVIKFRRMLTTGDPRDIAVTNTVQTVMWAYGNSLTLSSHGDHRGMLQVNLISTTTPPPVLLGSSYAAVVIAHGVFMVIAWCVLIPIGSFMARYMKAMYSWAKFHYVLTICGAVVALIAAVLSFAVSTNPFVYGAPVLTVHAWIGLIVLISGLLVQPVVGFLAHRASEQAQANAATQQQQPNQQPQPVVIPWQNKLHFWFGHAVQIGALMSVLLGLVAAAAHTAFYVVFVVYIVAVGAIVFVYERRRQQADKPQEQTTATPESAAVDPPARPHVPMPMAALPVPADPIEPQPVHAAYETQNPVLTAPTRAAPAISSPDLTTITPVPASPPVRMSYIRPVAGPIPMNILPRPRKTSFTPAVSHSKREHFGAEQAQIASVAARALADKADIVTALSPAQVKAVAEMYSTPDAARKARASNAAEESPMQMPAIIARRGPPAHPAASEEKDT
eukprot:TRINITY_DN4386_c0_g2_i1.p1 TRINITY_DN4386_c0_g2~~TRINITY_DN4386_c0_g2_i1.p1  ORF type:complete len:1226 (+),score=276.75 TRINITY_DN4386_c0_g2_i1:264-3680(+)